METNMPRTTSAKKALRQNVRRRKRNLTQRAGLQSTLKKFRRLASTGKQDEARANLSAVYKALDKAAKTGIVPRGRVDRLKSRLTKSLNRK